MAVYDRWHLARPPAGARKCGKHKKVPGAGHEVGLRWQVRGRGDHGRPVKRNFEYEEDAKAFDAELKAAVRAGTYVDDRAGKVTFREYAEDWRRTRTHGHNTAERVERGLRMHCYSGDGTAGKTPRGRMAIGDYPMSLLSRRTSLMREWVSDLPLQANTALLLIDTVRAVFEAAVDDRIIPRNPLRAESLRRDRPKYVPREVVAWTVDQVIAVAGEMPPDLAALVWLGASTGMRQGELLGVAVDDIDFLRRTVRVDAQVVFLAGSRAFGPVKNRKPRTVPVSRHVLPLLSQHISQHPPAEVTLPWSHKGARDDGKPVTRRLLFADNRAVWFKETVNRRWRAAWQTAGVPDLGRANGMHVLRHTAASTWLSNGLNPAKVAAWLGDTVAIVLKTYAHWLPQDDDLGRAIMDGFLAPQASERPDSALEGS